MSRVDTNHPRYAGLCDVAEGMRYTLEDVTGKPWQVTIRYLELWDVQFLFRSEWYCWSSGCCDTEKPIDRHGLMRYAIHQQYVLEAETKVKEFMMGFRQEAQ